MTVFVDTSAWIAYFDENDDFHEQANEVFFQKPDLITSNIVFHETIALLARRKNKDKAIGVGHFILSGLFIDVAVLSKNQELQAWNLFRNEKKHLSLVDWTIKVVMDDEGLTDIFTFDTDFDGVGLKRVPQ